MSVSLSDVEDLCEGRCIGVGGSDHSEFGQAFKFKLGEVGGLQPMKRLMIVINERVERNVGHRTVFKLLWYGLEEDSWDECHLGRSLLCVLI